MLDVGQIETMTDDGGERLAATVSEHRHQQLHHRMQARFPGVISLISGESRPACLLFRP